MMEPVTKMPPQAYLAEILTYDAETGKLFWKERPLSMFKSQRDANWWNGRYAGKEAFTCLDDEGYKTGLIHRKHCKAHRVIWKLVYGVEPRTVDHINNMKGDNRLVNLRECSHRENCCNYPKENSSSQYRGITRRGARWAAQIGTAKGRLNIGTFDSQLLAAIAYDEAAVKFHGEFATLNFPRAARAIHHKIGVKDE